MAKTVKRKELQPKPSPVKLEKGSEEEKAWLEALNNDLANIDNDYVDYAANHSDVLDTKNSQLMYMQKVRHMMMFQSCLRPLANGVNADSLVQTIGMYVGMRLFDKDFAKDVHSGIRDSMLPFVKNRAEAKGPDSKWAKWANKMELANNGGRAPLDPETAALTQIGFVKKAYDDMRQPGADIDAISKQYQEAVTGLYKVAAHDGVASADIVTHMRFKVGKMIEHDPSNMKYFNEICNDGVSMSDYKEEVKNVMGENGKMTQKSRYVWRGEFQNKDGQPFTGQFTPRPPGSADEYAGRMCEFCTDALENAYAKYPPKNAPETENFIYGMYKNVQKFHHKRVDEMLGRGDISKSDASKMKININKLEGVEMGVNDLPRSTVEDMVRGMSEAAQKYTENDTWVSKKSELFENMMHDDGFSDDEIKSTYKSVSKQGSMNAFVDIAHAMMDKQADKIRQQYEQRTGFHSGLRGRGQEFGSQFDGSDGADNVQYGV